MNNYPIKSVEYKLPKDRTEEDEKLLDYIVGGIYTEEFYMKHFDKYGKIINKNFDTFIIEFGEDVIRLSDNKVMIGRIINLTIDKEQ